MVLRNYSLTNIPHGGILNKRNSKWINTGDEKCIFCNGQEFKYPRDSRWGISAKAHKLYYNDKYKLYEYILYISKYDKLKNGINSFYKVCSIK